jgi:hypothetical protein
MLKAMGLVLIFLSALPTFCQSTSAYQVGTITAVTPHQGAAGSDPFGASYDVSVKVGDTVYVVLYTPPVDVGTVKYAAGRDLRSSWERRRSHSTTNWELVQKYPS